MTDATKTSIEHRIGSFVLLIPIAAILCAPALILHGWVIAKLWNWYVTPFFHTPTLTWPVALGMRICLGALTFRLEDINQAGDPVQKMGKSLIQWYSFPLLTLAIGWLLLWVV